MWRDDFYAKIASHQAIIERLEKRINTAEEDKCFLQSIAPVNFFDGLCFRRKFINALYKQRILVAHYHQQHIQAVDDLEWACN